MRIDDSIFMEFKRGKLDRFYQQIYPSLLAMADRLLPSDFSYLAEDCVQDSVYSAFVRRDSIESASHLNSYLMTCVHHQAVNIIRKNVRMSRYTAQCDRNLYEMDTEEQMLLQETLDMLYEAIDRLPPELQQMFELSFVEGLKTAEIAQRLSMSVSGVKKRKARLVDILKREMKDHDHLTTCIFLMQMHGLI